jgi:hypothetical protein
MDLLWENENIAKGTFQGITKVLLQTQIGYIKLSFGVFAKLIDINISLFYVIQKMVGL